MREWRLNDDVVLRRWFTLHYCTIVAVSATSDTARLSRYRYLPYDGLSHGHLEYSIYLASSMLYSRCPIHASANGHKPGARHDRVRGHCNRTRYVVRQVSRRYIEAVIVCCSSHGPLSPTSLLTDSCTWQRCDEEVRKAFPFYVQ